MTCAEFLEQYTDFRDGLITAPRELRRFERHLVRCAGCGRYDAAVRRSVLALQAAGTIEPSRDFRRRLDARLERERRAAREVPAPRRRARPGAPARSLPESGRTGRCAVRLVSGPARERVRGTRGPGRLRARRA